MNLFIETLITNLIEKVIKIFFFLTYEYCCNTTRKIIESLLLYKQVGFVLFKDNLTVEKY